MNTKNKSKKETENQIEVDLKFLFSAKNRIKGEVINFASPSFSILRKIPLFPTSIIADLEFVLQIKIKNPDFYLLALLHRSIIPYLQKKFGTQTNYELLNNERLEFLGDSVFNFIISEFLFLNLESQNEGLLSNLRSKLINRPILGEVARKLKLEEFIQTSFNARSLIEAGNLTILSNGLEALIGAVYLDLGFAKTKQFVIKIILPLLAECHEHDFSNYKSILMEYIQSFGKSFPTYAVLGEIGPDHQKKFIVGVYVENKLLGTGIASTKKEAEQIAAKKVLELSDNLL